ncbi:cupin domain-containing protein [Thalassobius sp. S69A]|uniref:cupin domain-containing protein n=1 Tax=unclassified Thalassovita TaxID=2619711 RepID=UPI000C4ABAED|nr:aldehyde dehydrogenase [Paracoccaceae bacterium]
MDFDVGSRLKAVRKANNLTQREVAARAGVTNGMISLIEANKTSPSVSSLKKILNVLDLTLSEFFEDNPDRTDKFWFRSDEFTEITPETLFDGTTGEGMKALSFKRLGPAKDTSLMMLYEVYETGADTGPEPYGHEGEEGGYVIEGELLLEVDGRTEILRAGDAYQFDSTKPHRFRNIGPERCIVVSALTPPTF